MVVSRKVKNKPNNIDILVAKNLKKRRKEFGFTQKELAIIVNVSVQQIQKYEKGKNRISSGNLFYFAQALEVLITYFFA
jgi:transcriptional regulator with XRE-family HTH domain